jgi:hypothetical protein
MSSGGSSVTELLGEFLYGLQRHRIALGERQNAAIEILGSEHFEHLARREGARRQAKHDEIGRPCLERRMQVREFDPLIESKIAFAESLAQELADVMLAVGDAD